MGLAAQADCIDDAALHHQVNPYVLRAIGWQESRLNPQARHRNANGTTDLGAFQINSVHFPALHRTGITSEALRDGCVSAYVAAWHYRRQVDRLGNTWSAVGAYHSTSQTLNHVYANAIARILESWGVLPSGPPPFPETRADLRRRPLPRVPAPPRSGPQPAAPAVAALPDGVVFDELARAPQR